MQYSDEFKKNLENFIKLQDKVGYKLLSSSTDDVPHSVIVTNAVYSPWYADQTFASHARHIQMNNYSLVNPMCLYELWDLVKQLSHLQGDIIEVGTWRGGSGCLMAACAKQEEIGCTTYLCDTFKGVVNTGKKDNAYTGGEHSDASEADVIKLANELGITNYKILTGIFPEETGHELEDKTFRLCHIDVDTYEGTRDIINWCWPRLEVGGIIVSDDLGSMRCAGVARAFQELEDISGRIKLYNINGHGLIIKTT